MGRMNGEKIFESCIKIIQWHNNNSRKKNEAEIESRENKIKKRQVMESESKQHICLYTDHEETDKQEMGECYGHHTFILYPNCDKRWFGSSTYELEFLLEVYPFIFSGH